METTETAQSGVNYLPLSYIQNNTNTDGSNSDRRKTTHSGASWRPGSRTTRRPSSACGRRCGRNAGRRCGSWYASYRTKPFPSSARPQNKQNNKTRQDKEKQTTGATQQTTDKSQDRAPDATSISKQDRRKDKRNQNRQTDGQKPTGKKGSGSSEYCAREGI